MINLGMGSEMTDLSNQECGGVSIKKLKRWVFARILQKHGVNGNV